MGVGKAQAYKLERCTEDRLQRQRFWERHYAPVGRLDGTGNREASW